jgi:hypothetical protein
MAHELIEIDDGRIEVKISGEMQIRDLRALQKAAAPSLAAGRRVCVLVVLEDFTGWEKSPGWGATGFLNAQGRDVTKMAIVGDERWRDEAYTFTGRGLRSAAIEYFPTGATDEARRWLGKRQRETTDGR